VIGHIDLVELGWARVATSKSRRPATRRRHFLKAVFDKDPAIQVLMQTVTRLYCTVGTSITVKQKLRGNFWWGNHEASVNKATKARLDNFLVYFALSFSLAHASLCPPRSTLGETRSSIFPCRTIQPKAGMIARRHIEIIESVVTSQIFPNYFPSVRRRQTISVCQTSRQYCRFW
jgi:hypothetical protein